ncbi:hypothetical protein HNP84_007363 [Thermocatellispora tengchongensis]|uniref:Type II toxin-antitoxin system RelE/ParE family toxin n=1 Tax=Thermocatellispora tengchongensis TaxID=1073253 RepID=A0A840PII1_9ACTN|nr:hypothetical protein [Thermocatellispora tengchongensis]MBB5137611.1 hypothetical protein [Thermocatellispora tengchongensis]
MSYKFTLALSALAGMQGLPGDALSALAARVADLTEEPWDAELIRPDRRDLRQTTFGGYGVVHFVVDDEAEAITITKVLWAG